VKRLIAILLLSATTLLSAAPGCDPCWTTCGPCGDFDLGVDYLYWKPAICEYKVAQKLFTDDNRLQIIGIKPDYDSGARVWLGYYKECTFARVSYLWLETTDNFTIERGRADAMFVPGGGILGFNRVRPSLRMQYQNVDVRLGQYLHRGRACTFGVYGNFRWIDLERRLRIRALGDDPQARIEQKSEFDGGGLGVGMTGDFCIWNGFSGFGEFGALAVIGERRAPVWRANRPIDTDGLQEMQEIEIPKVTCVIPALEFRAGVNYAWDCLCTTVIFEVGYELNYYWNALRYADLPVVVRNSLSDGKLRCRDVGFAGPYIGFHAMF
jgi:Legionella pneumophila major outer membrane protein precursor